MPRNIIFALIFMSFSVSASQDQDKKMFNDAIVNASWAGTCSAYKQIEDFQKATQMPGGDEFLRRFGATEIARLGTTPEKFIELCAKAIQNYNDMIRISQN